MPSILSAVLRHIMPNQNLSRHWCFSCLSIHNLANNSAATVFYPPHLVFIYNGLNSWIFIWMCSNNVIFEGRRRLWRKEEKSEGKGLSSIGNSCVTILLAFVQYNVSNVICINVAWEIQFASANHDGKKSAHWMLILAL